MKISRDNYEAYFLDYHEGHLSPEMVEEVKLFVKQNPGLENMFSGFEAISIEDDLDIVFEKKSSLKKNTVFATSIINELNYEEFLVSEAEGLLNQEQRDSLDEFISINPQFEKDRRLFAFAHLSPETDIVFEAKESLKQKAIPVGPINAETFEAFFAREIEGDLNQEEKSHLAEFLQFNPHLERDRNLYKKTILQADTTLVFEQKSSLKQSVIPLRRILYYTLSAAASLALVFSVYFLLDRNEIPGNIAQQGKVKNTLSKIITEPAIVIPHNQVAANTTHQDHSKSTKAQNIGKKSSSNSATTPQINNPVIEPLAFNTHQVVEPLQARSAREVTTRQYVDPQFTFIRVSQMYMNQNMEMYYNLKLAEEIQYAQINSTDKNPGKTIFNAAKEKVTELFAFNRKEPVLPKEDEKNISLWTFAELGVKTFNTVTSSELELNINKDDEGKVVGYGLQSRLLDYQKELKK